MPRPRLVSPTFKLRRNRSGVFAVSWTEDGRTRSVSTRETERPAAELWLKRWLAGRAQAALSSRLMADVLAAYADARKDRPAHRVICGVVRMMSAEFGHLRPAELDQLHIDAYARMRLAASVSPTTVVSELTFLRAALNLAVRRKSLSAAEKPLFDMPVRRAPPRDRWLTRDEAGRLIDAATMPHTRMFIMLGLYTGARSAAILSLPWGRVDLDAGRIDFTDPAVAETRKRRAVVPIAPPLLEELRRRRPDPPDPSAPVVTYRGGRVRDVGWSVRQACLRAGLEPIHPHVLRHTCATWLALSGVETRRAARFLGMTEAVFERVYGKHNPDYLRDAADALAG